MTESDEQLMTRVVGGDEAAFEQLMARHRQAVCRFLRSLFNDTNRAEDGAQEVFLRLWLARDRYRPDAPLRSYLFRIARNYFLNHVRDDREAPEAEMGDGVPVGRPAPPLPEDVLVSRYRLWQVRRAIASLPAHHRLVFTLAHDEGLPYAEIARVLDVPVGTVKSRMSAAVRMLRERLPDDE